MTILVSIDIESGVMRRYDSRYRGFQSGWYRYVCQDVDWAAVNEAGAGPAIVAEFYHKPSWRDHV